MESNLLNKFPVTRLRFGVLQIGAILVFLSVIGRYNYLLFHTLAEFFGAAIGMAIFLLAWNARKFSKNNYFLFFGTAFLVAGIISLIHGLTYRGMGVIAGTSENSNLATQLWLANEYILAIAFVAAPFLLGKKMKAAVILPGYLAVFLFLMLSIFYWKIFPVTYIEGTGLTAFKKISEYFVAFLFLLSSYFFWSRRNMLERRMLYLTYFILFVFFVSTVAFTLYVGVYSFPNELGHLLRVLAFYVSYLAFVESGLMRPYHSIFKDLKDKEAELKKAIDEWGMTFNSISDPIFILDINHTIIKANKALLEFLGKRGSEIIGKKCYEVVHKRHHPWVTCPLTMTKKDGRSHTEEVDDPTLGKVLLVTTSPILDEFGKIVGVAHIAKDITERKKMEKSKDEFISLASHQLRTPLSSIALSSELLLRGVAGEMIPEQKKYMEEVFKATKRMTLLINNLLNVSRVDMGNFETRTESVDASSAIREIVKGFGPLASEKKLKIDKNIEQEIAPIEFDSNSFGIIFENLLSNAIRYTGAGGNILIELKEDKAGLLLSVSDTGCGIPGKQKRKIFSKSFRAENAKEISSEGAGLGLYMAHIAAERSRAKIWFESEEGKGTTFFVLFAR